MLNRIDIMGRFVSDPELRRTSTGTAVCSFTIACERDFKGKDGNKETDFVNVVTYRNTAEFVEKYFTKGRMAVVSGRLQIRSWDDKDGNKRRTAEIVADNVYFGDSKQTSSETSVAPIAYTAPVQNEFAQNDFAMLDDSDSALPF